MQLPPRRIAFGRRHARTAKRDKAMNRPAFLPSRSLIFVLVRSLQEGRWLG